MVFWLDTEDNGQPMAYVAWMQDDLFEMTRISQDPDFLLSLCPMKKKKLVLSQPDRPAGTQAIKLRLDQRTTVTVTTEKAMQFWKTRYPNAMVID